MEQTVSIQLYPPAYPIHTVVAVSTTYGNNIEVIVSEDGTSVGWSHVVQPDIYAANGVIHIIDSLLIPEGTLQLTPEKYLLAFNCTTFVSLLHSTNLTELVNKTDSSNTILAARDDIIGLYDEPEDLPPAGSDELRRTLEYHFISGRYTPKHLKDGMLLETVLHEEGLGGDPQVVAIGVDEPAKKQRDISFGGASVLSEPGVLASEIVNLVSHFI